MTNTDIDRTKVVLVDENNKELGLKDKMEAHVSGDLHRAVSVLLFNSQGKVLIQRRALEKYHCPGLWANTCCTHPLQNETTAVAGVRRLAEEMGLESDVEYQFSFKYKAVFESGLIEHEYDDVYFGLTDNIPQINHQEVCDYRWLDIDTLSHSVKQYPQLYAEWFKIILKDNFDVITKYVNNLK